MSDVVDELRDWSALVAGAPGGLLVLSGDVFDRAADEIERLRALHRIDITGPDGTLFATLEGDEAATVTEVALQMYLSDVIRHAMHLVLDQLETVKDDDAEQ